MAPVTASRAGAKVTIKSRSVEGSDQCWDNRQPGSQLLKSDVTQNPDFESEGDFASTADSEVRQRPVRTRFSDLELAAPASLDFFAAAVEK